MVQRTKEQIANFHEHFKNGLRLIKSDAEVDRNIKRGFMADWQEAQENKAKPQDKPPAAPQRVYNPAPRPPVKPAQVENKPRFTNGV